MLHRVTVLGLLLFAWFSHHAQAAEIAIPPELEPWRDWVLQDDAHRRCPFLASRPATERESFRCTWPERLTLALGTQGGTFTQRWQVYAESWVRLPGSTEHWPQDVRVNGQPAALVAREGAPNLRLAPGSHTVTGRLSWSTRPEELPIDTRTAIVDLTLDGARVAQPERPNGSVWLGKRRSAEQPARMEIQVYRLLRDEIPARLVTTMLLQVSGEGREEILARVLPEGFTPLSLEGVLAARLESDGRLRVQVRPGSWEITLTARGPGVATQIARPQGDGLWAREEVWSFAGVDRLRIAAVQGAEGIDPVQANVPSGWRRYPAFRMPEGATLTVTERGRGLENADDNRLILRRQIWLDFDHRGLTAIDSISGDMRRDWRLATTEPFTLENARIGDETLLVTRNPEGEGSGIEIRTPNLNLTAVARTSRSRGELPATGWNARFENVEGVLNLPPGHLLLAVPGADGAPRAWLDRWGLWDLFGVLVVSVFAGWLAGRSIGVIAFLGLLLTYQDAPHLIWLWVSVIAAVAVARAVPEGRLRQYVRLWRWLAFAVLALSLLPFLWGQARLALHPQLEFAYASPMAPMIMPAAHRSQSVELNAAAPISEIQIEDMPAEAAAAEDEAEDENDSSVRGLNQSQVVQRYAPGTLLQTGPGVPRWRYRSYPYSWSGPVEPDQGVRFLYIGPVLLGIWRFAGMALLTALFLALLQIGGSAKWDLQRLRETLTRGFRGREAGAAVILLAAVLIGLAPQTRAADTPDPAILTELKNRLLRAPDCVPACADITAAQVTVRGDRLAVVLDVSALATLAVPVPSANDRWQLDTVTLDGRSGLTVGREGDGTLWVPVTTGVHQIRLEGSLARAESIQLAFPSVPRRISVTSDGWDVTGINEGRLLAGSLELVRRRSTADASAFESSSEFPAFVHVARQFDLGLDWSVRTHVRRIAPQRAALNVEVPLIAGESVLTQGLEVREQGSERVALVGLERGQPSAQWTSGLARAETLELAMPASAARSETWSFVVSPQWNVAFEGLPAVLPARIDDVWVYEFHPRPGEKLSLRITRPLRAEGGTLAIDWVDRSVVAGTRSTDTSLEFTYRSTQGGRHVIGLPPEARVHSVKLDDQEVQLRPSQGELSLGLLPGEHEVWIGWTEPVGAGFRIMPSTVDLHATASNVTTRIQVPERRWPLFVNGAGVGPAVVYWAELVVFVLTALLLGRWSQSPLKTHEWLLLGFGLSTLSWVVLVIVAAWLFAMRWREGWSGGRRRWIFNTTQVLLAILTVVAVSSLVFWGIRESLLASPDMGVAGPGSYSNTLSWLVDKTESALPQPQVFSVPMWVYRALMFAWALWIVVALLRWLRWAWRAWRTNGIWRGKVLAPAPA